MMSGTATVETPQAAASAAAGGSSSSRESHTTRNSKMPRCSSTEQAPHQQRHSRHSNSNRESSGGHRLNSRKPHSSSRNSSSSSHKRVSGTAECSTRVGSAVENSGGAERGGGDSEELREKRREEENLHAWRRGRRQEKNDRVRRAAERAASSSSNSSTGNNSTSRAPRHDEKGRRGETTDNIERQHSEEEAGAAAASSGGPAALGGSVRSRKDRRSGKEKKSSKESRNIKTDGPVVEREGGSEQERTAADAAAAAIGGTHSAQIAHSAAQERHQHGGRTSKPHRSHRERRQEQAASEKKLEETPALPSKDKRHAAEPGGAADKAAQEVVKTGAAPLKGEKTVTGDVPESGTKTSKLDSAGGGREHKEERQRERRRERDASGSRAEKKRRRGAEEQGVKKEGATAAEEKEKGARDGEEKVKDKRGHGASDGATRHRDRKHRRRERSPSSSPHQHASASATGEVAPSKPQTEESSNSGRRTHGNSSTSGPHSHVMQLDGPSSSSVGCSKNSALVGDSSSNSVAHPSGSSRRDRHEGHEGERRDKRKRSHRHIGAVEKGNGNSESQTKDGDKSLLKQASLSPKREAHGPTLSHLSSTVVQQRNEDGSSTGCNISSISKHGEAQLSAEERTRGRSTEEVLGEGRAGVGTEKVGKSNEKRSGRRAEEGDSSSSRTGHSSSHQSGSSSSSSKDKKSRRETDSRPEKHAKGASRERNRTKHGRTQSASRSVGATEAVPAAAVNREEAAAGAEQPQVHEQGQRQHGHQKQQPSGGSGEDRHRSKNKYIQPQQQEKREEEGRKGEADRSSNRRREKDGKKGSGRRSKSKKSRLRDGATTSSRKEQEATDHETKVLQQQQAPVDSGELRLQQRTRDGVAHATEAADEMSTEKEEGKESSEEQWRTTLVASGAAACTGGQHVFRSTAPGSSSRTSKRSLSSSRNTGDSNSAVAAADVRADACTRAHSASSSRRSVSSSSYSAGSGGRKQVVGGSKQLARSTNRHSVKGNKQGSLHRTRPISHNSSSRHSVCSTQPILGSRDSMGRSSHQDGITTTGDVGRNRKSKKQTKTSGGNDKSSKRQKQQQQEQNSPADPGCEGPDAATNRQDQFPSLSSSAAAAAAGAASLAAAAANAAAAVTAALRNGNEEAVRNGDLAKRSSISRSSCRSTSSSVKGRTEKRRRSSVRRNHSSRSPSRTGSWDSRSASRSRSRCSSHRRGRSGSKRPSKHRNHRGSRRRGARGRRSNSSREGSSSSRSSTRRRSSSSSSSRSRSSSGRRSRRSSRSTSGSTSSRTSRSRASSRSGSGKSSCSGSSRSRSRRSRSRHRSRSRSSRSTSRSSSSSRSTSNTSRSSSQRSERDSGSESGRSSSRSSTSSSSSSWRHRRQRRSRSRSSSRSSFAILNTADPTRNSQGDPFPPDLQGPCYIKVLPRARDPPVVLGIDNRGLIRLAKQHGCKLKLSAVDDVFPNTDRRLLLIYGGATANCVQALQEWVRKTAVKKPQQPPDKTRLQKTPASNSSGADKHREGQPQEKGAQQQPLQPTNALQKRGQQQKGRQQQRGQPQDDEAELEAELTFVIAQNAVRHMRISPWSSLDLTKQPAAPPAAAKGAAAAAATGDSAGTGSAATIAGDGLPTGAAGSEAITPAPPVTEKSVSPSSVADAVKLEEQQQHSSTQDSQQQRPAKPEQQQHQDVRVQAIKQDDEQKPPCSSEQQQQVAVQQQVKRERPTQQQLEEPQRQREQQEASTDGAWQQKPEGTGAPEKQPEQENGTGSNSNAACKEDDGTTVAAGATVASSPMQSRAAGVAASPGTGVSASGLPCDSTSSVSAPSEPGCAPHPDAPLEEQQQQQAVHHQQQASPSEQQRAPSHAQPSPSMPSQQQEFPLPSSAGAMFSATAPCPPPPPCGQQQEQTELTPEQLQQQQQERQKLEQERLLRQRSVWPSGTLLRDLHVLEGARMKLSRRQEMRWGCRERLLTLRGTLQDVQRALACVSFSLQYFLQQRDYMNVKYVRYTEERRRRRRSPSPLPTVPRIVLQEPALPSALVPGLQFQRVLQGLNVQDELVRMTNLRGIIDHHVVEMRGPAYVKVVISDLVTTLLLGTVKSEMENKSCPLRVIEKTCCVQAKVMDPEMPGILERVLVISGQPASVDKATMAVLEKVYAACIMAGQASQVTWRMCASNSAASLIIGTGGHRVKQLRHITNTRIQINTRDNVPVVDRWERVVTITGTYAAVAAAARAMLPFMHADPNHGQHVHQCYGTGTRLEMPEWAEQAVQREGMDEEAGRRPPLPDDRDVSFTGPCFLKLLIDNALANALIGKDCQTIVSLSEATQCVMKFAPPTTVFPGCPGERVLGLSGSAEAINNAAIAIIEKCKEVHPNLSYDQMYGKMIVPHTCCSSIIGAGGSRIREIREATLTRIAVSKKGLNTPERLVCIFGMPQGVHTALVTIFGIIQCDPGIRVMLDIVYPPEVEGENRKKEADRLSIGLIGAVLEGVQAVVNKVGVDETAEAALKKLQEMQRAAAIAAGELPPDAEEGEFRGPLGPMGQTRGAAQHTNYSAPISFIPASSHLPSTTASEASLAMLPEDGASAPGALRALGGAALPASGSPSQHLQALAFGMPGGPGDVAAAAEMGFSSPWGGAGESAAGSNSRLLQLQAAESNAPLGISRTASIYAGAGRGQLLDEDAAARTAEAAAAAGLPLGVDAPTAAQQGMWGTEHSSKMQQQLTRQEKRQRLLEASLNRGLGGAAAREERQLTAAGEHISGGGEEDQHDEDEDLSLAGLMDEKF